MGAQRGDKMIIFLSNNEQFLDGFWAAVCGGIVPVPLAVGISDEHRHKLLRVARKLGKPLLYTDAKNLERLQALAAEVGRDRAVLAAQSRAPSWSNRSPTSRGRAKLHRPAPEDLAFIQFSSGSTSEPKGVMLTHGNLIANIAGRDGRRQVQRSGRDLELDAADARHGTDRVLPDAVRQSRAHQSDADRTVRAAAAAVAADGRRRSASRSPARRISAIGISSRCWAIGAWRTSTCRAIRLIYNGAEPISVQLCNEFMKALAYTGLKRQAMYPVYGLAEACLAVTFPELGLGLSLDSREPAQARRGRADRTQSRRRARRARTDVRGPRRAEHGIAHRGRCARARCRTGRSDTS